MKSQPPRGRWAGIESAITVVTAAIGKIGGQREAAAPGADGKPWPATHPLPNAGAALQPAPGTRPELTPVSRHYRIDINTSPPLISEATWRLKIHGLIARPIEWTLADLRARPAMHQPPPDLCGATGFDTRSVMLGTARIMGVKHLSPAGVASGLYAALMNVIFLAQRIGTPLAL